VRFFSLFSNIGSPFSKKVEKLKKPFSAVW